MFKSLLFLLVVFSPSTQLCEVSGTNKGENDNQIYLDFDGETYSPPAYINPKIRNSEGFVYLLIYKGQGKHMEREIFLKPVAPAKVDGLQGIFKVFDRDTRKSKVVLPEEFCDFDDSSEALTSKELTLTKKRIRAQRRILL